MMFSASTQAFPTFPRAEEFRGGVTLKRREPLTRDALKALIQRTASGGRGAEELRGSYCGTGALVNVSGDVSSRSRAMGPEAKESIVGWKFLGSAVALTGLFVLLAAATAAMLFKLYQTSNQLAESNRRTFVLDTSNKKATLEQFFRRRAAEIEELSRRRVFEDYFEAKALGVTGETGLATLAGRIEEELLMRRLGTEEQGRSVYASVTFFDIVNRAIVARTDFSPRARWINEQFLESLAHKAPREVEFGSGCEAQACRLYAFTVVRHGGADKGLIFLELDPDSVWGRIQLPGLQKVDDFSGLCNAQGLLVLGPSDLTGKPVTETLGASVGRLAGRGDGSDRLGPGKVGKRQVLIDGARLPDTGFVLLHVAPQARFSEERSPFLWGLVFACLMGGLALTLAHIFLSYTQRHVMYQRLREAHDNLELRVEERTFELQHVNRTLKEEVGERMRAEEALRKAGQELQETNKELKDFAHVVSHDLKAPLRAVSKLTKWLSDDYGSVFDDDGKYKMKLLLARVERMHNLIEGILQYSRIGRNRELLKEVDLDQLLLEVVDSLDPPDNIQIVVATGLPTVKGEETRLREVFQNLVDNAIKYMDKPQGNIKVTCAAEEMFWRFSVSDNGPGISQQNFDRIWRPFQTANPQGGSDGSGLGLALVKKIVELHGGVVWVESKVGAGSVFSFTLPREDAAALREETLDEGERYGIASG